MINVKDEAWDFLCYSYFEILNTDTDDVKAKKCAHRAYLDLARTLSYDKNSDEEDRKDFVHRICELIVQKIGNKEDHFDICQAVCTAAKAENILINGYKRNEKFYYGQAQKWVNMTMKYMWLIGLIEDRSALHIPVDSYIMEAASEEGIQLPQKSSNNYGKFSFESLPWSKWEEPHYKKFVEKSVILGECPIDWEFKAWINVAEKHKKKNNQKA